jgi:hypothetical protein
MRKQPLERFWVCRKCPGGFLQQESHRMEGHEGREILNGE